MRGSCPSKLRSRSVGRRSQTTLPSATLVFLTSRTPGSSAQSSVRKGRAWLRARSIEHRFPYLDPLNHLQVELVKRHRAWKEQGKEPDIRVHRGIHMTINGVAAGLRNTG